MRREAGIAYGLLRLHRMHAAELLMSCEDVQILATLHIHQGCACVEGPTLKEDFGLDPWKEMS